jgi:hypothetical protein
MTYRKGALPLGLAILAKPIYENGHEHFGKKVTGGFT